MFKKNKKNQNTLTILIIVMISLISLTFIMSTLEYNLDFFITTEGSGFKPAWNWYKLAELIVQFTIIAIFASAFTYILFNRRK